jgi:FkbM family methyltransferase
MKPLMLFKILRSILNHPLNRKQKGRAIIRFIRWQIGSRLALGPVVVRFVGESQLIAEPGFSGVTGNVYTGLYEFEDMAFVLHFLRESDRFVDVGANIGAYTILASSVIGAKCIAIEPVPITFKRLCDNVNINGVYDRVRCLKLGISSTTGMLRFTTTLGAMNHVAVGENENTGTIELPVNSLDEVAGEFKPSLVKIDVEGFETKVIEGADDILSQEGLYAVSMELREHGKKYGFDEMDLHKKMICYGFVPYRYFPFTRELSEIEGIDYQKGNTLYLRNKRLPIIRERIRAAPKFFVNHHNL